MPKAKGRELNEKWGVGARHSLYSKKGTWYHHLERFPEALFDQNGYLVFQTRAEYERCPHLDIGQELNVHLGIANIPGYVRLQNSN